MLVFVVLQQQKYLKRSSDELQEGGGGDGGFEPPPKMQCTGQQQQGRGGGGGGNNPNENLTKFSVEIVQQLEFTTSSSAVSSQTQQISTNVTVKAMTNVKSDVAASPAGASERGATPKSNPGTPASAATPGSSAGTPQQQSRSGCGGGGVDLGSLVECKQEPGDGEFVDLEQCAAALEKDAAANGVAFPGFSDLIGDETSDAIISSDAFKDLISEFSDFHPEFMKVRLVCNITGLC